MKRQTSLGVHLALLSFGIGASAYMSFIYAPLEATMGNLQRLFYLHLPLCAISMCVWPLIVVCDILCIIKGKTSDLRFANDCSIAASEGSLIFLALGVCTGMIWARPLWGQWWVGDMKLTSTAQLLYLTLGYVLLRRGVRDSRDLHWSNWILGILILPDVIIAYFANQWFRTQHPQPVIGGGQGSGLDVRMAYTLVVTTATLFILFLYIVRTRLGIYRLSRERLALQDSAALNTFLRLGL